MDFFADFSWWWKTVWWLVSLVGIGGLIAIFAAYPIVATIVVRFFSVVFSYRIGCAVVAAVFAALVADYWRHSIEDERHAAEVAAFEQKQRDRDERIKKETLDEVLKEAAAAAAENAATDKTVKDFTDALPIPAETGNPFAVGADACRLREIAGQARCGSVGVEGVPAPDTGRASIRDRIKNRLSGVGSGGTRSNQ